MFIRERKIFRIRERSVLKADKTDWKLLEQLQNEPKVLVEVDPYECCDLEPGTLLPCRTISINGIPWHLKPGRTEIPNSVYEAILHNEAETLLAHEKNKALKKSQCLKDFVV